MISIAECKKILNKDGKKYSDTEVEKIRTLLIRLAEIELEQYNRRNETEAKHFERKYSNKARKSTQQNVH